jgi:ribosomal protein S18 acetylase RimI-like enzyme
VGEPNASGGEELCWRALTPQDFEPLQRLAHDIWRNHYPGIISHAQIDYMLRGRFAPDALARYVDAKDRWLELLLRAGEPIGYCSYACGEAPEELKLEQLYLLSQHRGRGLGGRMLDHVERAARALLRSRLVLTVNKANRRAIEVYLARGFTVRTELRLDIGEGFLMDDYVMEKRLSGHDA